MLPHPQAVCYSEQFSEELNRSYRHCALFGENTETIQTIVINGTAETPGQAVTINLHTKRRFHEGFQFQPFVSFSLAGDMCSAASRVESASVSSASENKIRDWVNQEFKNTPWRQRAPNTHLPHLHGGAYSLGADSFEPRIWDLAAYALAGLQPVGLVKNRNVVPRYKQFLASALRWTSRSIFGVVNSSIQGVTWRCGLSSRLFFRMEREEEPWGRQE